jgi:hypothetical protein
MTQDANDLVRRLHQEEVERMRQQKAKERAVVEALFEQTLQKQLAEEACGRALVVAAHREACEQARSNSPPVEQARGIPYTELPEAKPGEPLAEEWNTYRREVGRLLAEGQAGRHVLIQGGEIRGIFATSEEAYEEGWKHFPGVPFFVHPIRAEEPYLRIRGVNLPWPSSPSR